MTIATKSQGTKLRTHYGIQWQTKGRIHTHFASKTLDSALARAKQIQRQGKGGCQQFIIFSYHVRSIPDNPRWQMAHDGYAQTWNIDGTPYIPGAAALYVYQDIMGTHPLRVE